MSSNEKVDLAVLQAYFGKQFEAGIRKSTYPYNVVWTGQKVTAKNTEEAEDIFTSKGFYRNLEVREI